jgi:hypothetical protein
MDTTCSGSTSLVDEADVYKVCNQISDHINKNESAFASKTLAHGHNFITTYRINSAKNISPELLSEHF